MRRSRSLPDCGSRSAPRLRHRPAHEGGEVESEIGEGDERPEVMQRPGDFRPSQEGEDHPGPVGVVELERHPRQDEQEEARDHQDVEEALERAEAGELLVVGGGLNLRLPECLRVVQVQVDRPHDPQECVQAEKGEDADEQRRHRDIDLVKKRVMRRVEGVGMRPVLRELDADTRVALLAGRDDAPLRQARPRVADREDVVMPVAVIAGGDRGGDIRPSERHRLAVVGLVVVDEPVLVAAAAHLVAGRLEGDVRRILDLVGAVAVRADRPARVALGEEDPWTLWL